LREGFSTKPATEGFTTVRRVKCAAEAAFDPLEKRVRPTGRVKMMFTTPLYAT
jgi:hypothetical protein